MRKSNVYKYVYLILALLPLLILLLPVWRSGSPDLVSFESSLSWFRDFPITQGLNDYLLNIGWFDSSNIYCLIILDYFSYFLMISLFDLMFYCFTFFIRIIKSFVDKLGGSL